MRIDERDLAFKFQAADKKVKDINTSLKIAKKELDEIETALIEYLDNETATATAKYDGLGYVRMNKPRPKASCKEENHEKLIEYLTQIERKDMIKNKFNGLSEYVKGLLKEGKEVPECIGYYFVTTLTLVPQKGK